jgi:hypothetical protein
MTVLPRMSNTRAPAGTATRAPTETTRSSLMTTVPRSITSSPRMVMTRAFVSATVPRGRAVSNSKPMRVERGSGVFSSLASCFWMFSRLCS